MNLNFHFVFEIGEANFEELSILGTPLCNLWNQLIEIQYHFQSSFFVPNCSLLQKKRKGALECLKSVVEYSFNAFIEFVNIIGFIYLVKRLLSLQHFLVWEDCFSHIQEIHIVRPSKIRSLQFLEVNQLHSR
jgi:hypothetical protein